jgi:urease accessory protein
MIQPCANYCCAKISRTPLTKQFFNPCQVRTPIESELLFSGSWVPFLLQTCDPLFPTGSYAHSYGMEELVRLGAIRNEASLASFLENQLLPQIELQELPYLRFAYESLHDIPALCEIDFEIDAWKPAKESREASVQVGIRRLNALRAVSSHSLLEHYNEAIASHIARGHHLCVCAIQTHVQNVPLEAALYAYAYLALSGACAAALKLIRIGQEGIQRALSQTLLHLSNAVDRSLSMERPDAGCFSPLLEIASMRHAHAHERLFIS